MGLDMYLMKKHYISYQDRNKTKIMGLKGINFKKVRQIEEEAGYWRKANAIHGWFVDNVQDGNDDCKPYYVTREKLHDLLGLVNKVLAASELVNGDIQNGLHSENGKTVPIMEKGQFIKDPSVAKELLPVREGFFFGNYNPETAYDQYYVSDLKDTKQILEGVLEDENCDIYYESSW